MLCFLPFPWRESGGATGGVPQRLLFGVSAGRRQNRPPETLLGSWRQKWHVLRRACLPAWLQPAHVYVHTRTLAGGGWQWQACACEYSTDPDTSSSHGLTHQGPSYGYGWTADETEWAVRTYVRACMAWPGLARLVFSWRAFPFALKKSSCVSFDRAPTSVLCYISPCTCDTLACRLIWRNVHERWRFLALCKCGPCRERHDVRAVPVQSRPTTARARRSRVGVGRSL